MDTALTTDHASEYMAYINLFNPHHNNLERSVIVMPFWRIKKFWYRVCK